MSREHPIRERLDSSMPPDMLEQLPQYERIELVRLLRLPEVDRKTQLDAMERAKRRRFQRALEQMAEEQERHGKQSVTKGHLAWALGRYTETKLIPLAARLDAAERYLEYLALPFYRRWWVDLRRIATREIPELGQRLVRWLDRRGVRFIRNVDEDKAITAEAQALLAEEPKPEGETQP